VAGLLSAGPQSLAPVMGVLFSFRGHGLAISALSSFSTIESLPSAVRVVLVYSAFAYILVCWFIHDAHNIPPRCVHGRVDLEARLPRICISLLLQQVVLYAMLIADVLSEYYNQLLQASPGVRLMKIYNQDCFEPIDAASKRSNIVLQLAREQMGSA